MKIEYQVRELGIWCPLSFSGLSFSSTKVNQTKEHKVVFKIHTHDLILMTKTFSFELGTSTSLTFSFSKNSAGSVQ